MSKVVPIKNTQLIVSAAVVIPVSFGYGLAPSVTLPYLFDFQVETVDLHNIFRAVMGLYLANATLWVLGILKPCFWETATLANVFFMGGLALGRLLSLLLDGVGSPVFALGMVAEAGMAIWGVLNLRQMRRV